MDYISEIIKGKLDGMSKLEKRIATYILNSNDVFLIESSNTLAERAGVSPMTVTRFFRKLGFSSAAEARDDIKRHLRQDQFNGLGQRFDAVQGRLGDHTHHPFCDAVTAGLRQVDAFRNQPDWQSLIAKASQADSLYVAGIQTMGYLAEGLMMKLSYLRPNVHALDGQDGSYAKLYSDPAPRKVLILIDVYRYGRISPLLAQAARDLGIEVILLCDSLCDWGQDLASHMLAVPTDASLLFGPATAIHYALELLVLDVGEALGNSARKQMDLLAQAQETFGQYLK